MINLNERLLQLYELDSKKAQMFLVDALLQEMESFLFNIRCYYFPQYQSERLNQRTLIFEVADYTHNFPKIIQRLLTTTVSKEHFVSYLSELEDYYNVFDEWQGEGDDRKLEHELVQNVLTNRQRHAKKLGL